MAKTKILFVADDGKEFDTEEAANAHDTFLKSKESIEAYITYAGLEKAQAGLLRTHIAGYLAHVEAGQPERTAAELEALAKAKAEAKAKGAKKDEKVAPAGDGGSAE